MVIDHICRSNAAFVGLLGMLGFVWFVKALYVDAIVSPFGTAMVQAMTTSRLTYAMRKLFSKKLNEN